MTTRNIDPLMGRLIASGKCSLVDLKEKLTLEEAYGILEAEYVALHNENALQEKALAKAEKENSRSAI